MLRRLHLKLIPSLVFLALAGCGGGGGDSGTTSGTAPVDSSTGSAGDTGNAGGTGDTGGTPTSQTTLAAATTLADGATVGSAAVTTDTGSAAPNGQAVGTLSCGQAGASYTYTHLSIIQDGVQLTLPADIGVVAPTDAKQTGCVYPLHTDDASGKIRVDATATAPTLGQFFAVWGQPLSSTSVAGLSNRTVTAYVNDNGTLTKVSGDPSAIALTPNREITLISGNVPSQLPTYTWNAVPPLSTDAADRITLNDMKVGTVTQWADGDTATGGQGDPVQGPSNLLTCGVMSEDFHIHTHLAVFKDGQMLVVPQHIGIPQTVDINGNTSDKCNYDIHTHDPSGVLHVETPTAKNFTLGDAFAIWGQPLSTTNVAGLTGQPIRFFINDNGDVREYVGDPTQISLRSHRAITIQVGTPVAKLPTYVWDSEPTQ